MAANLISTLAYNNFKPSDSEQLIRDGGGLFVRIRSIASGGKKSFRQSYRLDGKLKWIDLQAKTLPEARKERDEIKRLVKSGIDPKLGRQLQAERNRQAQLEEQAEIARIAALRTVTSLYKDWISLSISSRKDLAEITRMFEKDVLPVIGAMLVQDVRKAHISGLINNLILRDAKHTARNLLKLIRQMFRFAVDQDLIDTEPTATISIVKATTKPTERERVLSEIEIRALARQLPDAGLLPTTVCALWIALATGCRIGELSKAKWADVRLDLKTWTIPADNSKNGKAHKVYLSDFALEQFKILASYRTNETWLYPNRDNSSHVCEKSITKQVQGRQTDTILSGRSKDNKALVLDSGRWTMHDLRRTAATLMGNLRVAPDVIEKCLNHTEENKVKRIYQRQGLEREQAEAWQVLGQQLELIRNMDSSNVVLLGNTRW